MKTMMRIASIVVLLGLATLTNAAAPNYDPKEPVPEKRFIITPTKMNSAQEKASKMDEFWNFRSKYNERIKSWVDAKEVLKKADEEVEAIDHKIAGEIEEHGQWVDVKAKLTKAEAHVADLTKWIADLKKTDKTDAAYDKTIDGLKEAKDKAAEADKPAAQAALEEAEKKLAAMETAKPKWEAKVTTYKDEVAKFTKGMTPTEAGKPDTAPYRVEKTQKDAAQTKAAEEVAKFAETTTAAWPKDGKPGEFQDDGGAGYWKNKMTTLSPTMDYWTPDGYGQLQVGTDPVASALTIQHNDQQGLFQGVEFEGFFGDAADGKFIVKAKRTLEQVQEQLKYKLKEYKGKEDEAVLATVEEAKDTDKCNLITSTLVKMAGDTYDHDAVTDEIQNLKDHSAEINGFVIGLQTVTMTDRIKQKVTPKADGGNDYEDLPAVGDPAKKPTDDYPMLFINVQGMGLDVYRNGGSKQMFSKRDGIEIVGDMNAISAGPTTGGGDGASKGEDGGSNTWMIVAIIFIVIVVLGGLGLGYQAYNASGSLQNTDI